MNRFSAFWLRSSVVKIGYGVYGNTEGSGFFCQILKDGFVTSWQMVTGGESPCIKSQE